MRLRRLEIYRVAILTLALALTTTSASAQWINTTLLTASDGQSDDNFGDGIAIDGDILVVGATAHNQLSGAAYVFTQSNGVWTQVAELTPSNATPGLFFGLSVAISGNTIVVGAGATDTLDAPTFAYVFVKPAIGWTNMTETARLAPSDRTSSDGFGKFVAVSKNTIIVGADGQQIGSNQNQGAAYVFVKPATGWKNMTQTAELTASDGATGDHLGDAVAIQGSTVVVGAMLFQSSSNQGAVYVFEGPTTGWANENQTAKLTATDPNVDAGLGTSVAISSDEATIVAGAPGWRFGTVSGAAYIFSKPTAGWQNATQSAELIAPRPALFFGLHDCLAINGPGTIIAVGAPLTKYKTAFNEGVAYVYRKPSTGWPLLPQANAKLSSPSPRQNGYFGDGIAVRATTVLVGEFGANVNGNASQGAVYVFDRH